MISELVAGLTSIKLRVGKDNLQRPPIWLAQRLLMPRLTLRGGMSVTDDLRYGRITSTVRKEAVTVQNAGATVQKGEELLYTSSLMMKVCYVGGTLYIVFLSALRDRWTYLSLVGPIVLVVCCALAELREALAVRRLCVSGGPEQTFDLRTVYTW